jgi:hypothetical protein
MERAPLEVAKAVFVAGFEQRIGMNGRWPDQGERRMFEKAAN